MYDITIILFLYIPLLEGCKNLKVARLTPVSPGDWGKLIPGVSCSTPSGLYQKDDNKQVAPSMEC